MWIFFSTEARTESNLPLGEKARKRSSILICPPSQGLTPRQMVIWGDVPQLSTVIPAPILQIYLQYDDIVGVQRRVFQVLLCACVILPLAGW
jgi:hypothetical protein